jgi:NAD(P)-dependent dehydrogenase (short-subunit alcohol dehydrogenase family)
MSHFTTKDIPDLSGRTAIVTGGSSGIGKATAAALARAGAHVVIAARDTEKAARAVREMPGSAEARALDLADLGSVRRFAEAWEGPIDLLINNAGVAADTLRHTADGFETQFGTNHLGHFALTGLLLPHVTGRVVTVASQAERMARADFLDDPNFASRPYNGSVAYNNSKLANLLFVAELARRLEESGSPVRAMAAHPGLVATAIYDRPGPRRFSIWSALVPLLAQQPDEGALPTLYAAVADLPTNTFTGPRHLMHMRGGATVIKRSPTAADPALARRLWDLSTHLTQPALTP